MDSVKVEVDYIKVMGVIGDLLFILLFNSDFECLFNGIKGEIEKILIGFVYCICG